MPAALLIAAPNRLAATCQGTASAPASATSISLSGGQLGPGASCTVTLRVLGATGGRVHQHVHPGGLE